MENITKIVLEIVESANVLIQQYIPEELALDYVDIFPTSEKEGIELINELEKAGKKICRSHIGQVYLLDTPIKTQYGLLKLVRVRAYDKERNQRGAPDFKVKNYDQFKAKCRGKDYFNLIDRTDYEMLELNIEGSNVLVYFPSELLSDSLGLK